MITKKFYGIVALGGGLLLALDGVVKGLVHHFLPVMSQAHTQFPYGGLVVFHNLLGIDFAIHHATNTGAVWGTFAGFQMILVGLRVAIIIAMTVYLIAFNKHRLLQVPLALIIVGAMGNVLDFFFYGHVVDMFHFRFWGWNYAVFNLADAYIFIGVGWLLLHSFFHRERPVHEPEN